MNIISIYALTLYCTHKMIYFMVSQTSHTDLFYRDDLSLKENIPYYDLLFECLPGN